MRHGFDTDGASARFGRRGPGRDGFRAGVAVGRRRRVDRAQHLVAVDDVEDRRPHRGHVEVAAQTDHDGDHVGGGVRIELVEEPHPALGVRDGYRVRPADRLERGQIGTATVLPRIDGGGQRPDRRRLEQRADSDLHAERAIQAGHHPGRRQRGAAEIEERRLGRHLLRGIESEDLGVDRGDRLLGCRRRTDVDVFTETRCGQRPAVELSGGRQRDVVDRHDHGGHHVGGEPSSRVGRDVCGVGRSAGDTMDPGHEDRLTRGRVFDSGGRREVHPGVLAENRVDLTEFDPETPDLDLEVAAAQEVQRPAAAPSAPSYEITGPVHPLARRAERCRDEALGGQRGLADVAGGEGGTRQIQFTGHAGGNGMQAGIENCGGDTGDRTADGDRGVGPHRCRRCRPDGGLGGTVEIAHRATGGPCPDQFRRTDVTGDGDDLEIGEPGAGRRARFGDRLGHRGEGGRGDRRVGDALPPQDRREFGAARDPAGHHDHGRRGRHRDQCLEHRGVETRCREAEYARRRRESESRTGIGDQIGQPAVGDRDAFRPAGRAGREDDIGRLVGARTSGGRDSGLVRTAELFGNDPVHRRSRRSQPGDGLGRGDPQTRVDGGQHVAQALPGQAGVDGRHRRARARDRPEPDRAFERSRCGEGDHGVRRGAARTKYVGQPARTEVELGVRQVLPVLGDRDAVGVHGDRGVQQVGERRPRRRETRCRDHRIRVIVSGGQVADRRVRLVHHRSRDGGHPTDERVHRAGIEEGGGIGDDHARVVGRAATRLVEDRDLQVDLRGGDRGLDLGDDDPRQLDGRPCGVLECQSDLDQRRMRGVAYRDDLVDHGLER